MDTTPETNTKTWANHFEADSTLELHHSSKFPKVYDGEDVVSYTVTREGLALFTETCMAIIPNPYCPVLRVRVLGKVKN